MIAATADTDRISGPERASGLRLTAILACWLTALWLLTRPFLGLRHDGIFYMAQAMQHWMPSALSEDIFFRYGSQDQFSVFPRLMAWMYDNVGRAATQQIALAVCHAALVLVMAGLLRPIPQQALRWLGLVAVATMSHYYGGRTVFSFAETFLTARTLAEPLSLAALLAWMSGWRWGAAALWVAAAAMHPLMALPVALVCWVERGLADARWWWAALPVAVVVALLSLAGLGPFATALRTFDTDWLRVLQAATPHLFVFDWGLAAWSSTALDLGILCLARPLLPTVLKRVATAVVLVCLGTLVATVIGSDLLHNVLLTQLQVWRSLWLARLFALLLLPLVLWHTWKRSDAGRGAAVALALATLAINREWGLGWAFLAWAGLMHWVASGPTARISVPMRQACFWVSTSLLALMTPLIMARYLREVHELTGGIGTSDLLWALVSTPTASLPLAWAVFWVARGRLRLQGLAAVGAAAALITGIATWDRRDAWRRYAEDSQPGQHVFAVGMAKNAQVYWHGQLLPTWTLLGRPSFFSSEQGAGLVFNRETAVEFARRMRPFVALKFQQEICSVMAAVSEGASKVTDCVPDLSAIEEICRLPKGPDYLVFPYALTKGEIARWTFVANERETATFYLHDCKLLR